MMLILVKDFLGDWRGEGGGRRAWGLKTERYINIYIYIYRYGEVGEFEIGQRLEIFIFRGVG